MPQPEPRSWLVPCTGLLASLFCLWIMLVGGREHDQRSAFIPRKHTMIAATCSGTDVSPISERDAASIFQPM